MFVDSGTYGGRMSNNQSQMGGWPVYLFQDAVVFMTMPAKARLATVGHMTVDLALEYVKGSSGAPGPNKAMHENVRKAQEESLRRAVQVVEAHGIDNVTAGDMRAVDGAIVVAANAVAEVRLTRTGVFRKASKLVFTMRAKDPDVPFYERTLMRRYTLGMLTPREDVDGLALALQTVFGDRFTDGR